MTHTLSFLGDTAIECVKIILVMCGVLNYRLRKTIVPLIILILSLTAFFIFHDTLSKVSIICSSVAAILLNCFTIEGKNNILVTVLVFLSICCLDEINTTLLIAVMPVSYDEIIDNAFYKMLANSLGIVLVSLISCLSKSMSISQKYTRNMRLIDKFYLYLFVIGQVGVLVYISIFNVYNKEQDNSKTNLIIMFVGCVAIVLLLVIEFMLIYNINSKKYYRQMSAVNQKLLNDKENYYKMLLNRENETKKFRHDISNHILCLDVLLEEEKYNEAKEYLSSMKFSTAALKNKYDTGNILINAIVNDIISRYEGVNLEWNGGVPDELLISDVDICTIFSNILDNAFKAAGDTDGKNVDVSIKSIANNMMIVVENDKSNKVNMVNGRFVTSKDDKENHGIGTQNVRDCVNSYNGNIEYVYDDTRFSVEILLPNVLSVME